MGCLGKQQGSFLGGRAMAARLMVLVAKESRFLAALGMTAGGVATASLRVTVLEKRRQDAGATEEGKPARVGEREEKLAGVGFFVGAYYVAVVAF